MQVLFTPLAERQLVSLHDYIAARSGEARADAYLNRIISYCRGFSTFPKRGIHRDDLLPGLRIIGFERRVTIAFIVTGEAILIEGVFYGGQDVEASFRDES